MNETKTDGAAPALKFANCTNEVERQIIVLLVEDLLGAGYSLGVYDCEEVTLAPTRDESRIFAAMFTTDDDHLLFRKDGQEGVIPRECATHGAEGFDPETEPGCAGCEAFDRGVVRDGWIRLVYGNGGDVISDYTTNLDETTMERASELADRFSGRARARARREASAPDYKLNVRNMLAGDSGASPGELADD